MSALLYAELNHFRARPEPFSVITTEVLWTDPHIARQMLAAHLAPDSDGASRRHATIGAFVGWVDARLSLSGKRVTDLGCGPGLYLERMARRGAVATGVDLSATALAHARCSAAEAGLAVTYMVADYLKDPLPEAQDIVFLICGDYCALAPDQRATLLRRIRHMLAPGGVLVFDVCPPGQMANLSDDFEGNYVCGNGFWSPDDCFAFRQTHLWPDQCISLEHFLVATPHRQFEIFHWKQYFTPATIAEELARAAFVVEAQLEFDTGFAWQGGATPLTLIARPI